MRKIKPPEQIGQRKFIAFLSFVNDLCFNKILRIRSKSKQMPAEHVLSASAATTATAATGPDRRYLVIVAAAMGNQKPVDRLYIHV